MNEYTKLKNKTAIITGGGRGIGLAIAKKFSEYGIEIVIIGKQEDTLKESCDELVNCAQYYPYDLSHLKGIPGLIDKIEEETGKIDILVNNAGIHLKKDVLEISDEEFQRVIQINQNAVFTLTREVAKKMQTRKTGNIIMISSMASRYGLPKVIAYTASKSAIEGMTRALAVELSPIGIRINCIAPGFIKTNMSQKALEQDPERLQRVLSRTPLKRLGEPEDVANTALFLVSDAAKFITGTVLPVDGGNSIGF